MTKKPQPNCREREELLGTLVQAENPDERLRMKHIGSVLNPEILPQQGFENVTGKDADLSTWKKEVDNRSITIWLRLTPGMRLCRLDASRLLDLSDVGVSGLFRWGALSEGAEASLGRALEECIVEKPLGEASEEWFNCLDLMGIELSRNSTSQQQAACEICATVDRIRQSPDMDNVYEVVLLFSLLRHLDSIEDINVWADLPYMCGRLGLLEECIVATRSLLTKGVDLPATGWTNTGCVLCDNVRDFDSAFLCFKRAIDLDPDLPQPRQGIWLVAKGVLGRALGTRELDGIADLVEMTRRLGAAQHANAGFWTYAGLAYELQGDKIQAKNCYFEAEALDANEQHVVWALQRLSGDEDGLSLPNQLAVVKDEICGQNLQRIGWLDE